MSAHTILPVECWEIPQDNGLDRIQVYWSDLAPGRGRVTIACWGRAWTAEFLGMGPQTIRQYFIDCDAVVLAKWIYATQDPLPLAVLTNVIDAVKDAISSGGAA